MLKFLKVMLENKGSTLKLERCMLKFCDFGFSLGSYAYLLGICLYMLCFTIMDRDIRGYLFFNS